MRLSRKPGIASRLLSQIDTLGTICRSMGWDRSQPRRDIELRGPNRNIASMLHKTCPVQISKRSAHLSEKPDECHQCCGSAVGDNGHRWKTRLAPTCVELFRNPWPGAPSPIPARYGPCIDSSCNAAIEPSILRSQAALRL